MLIDANYMFTELQEFSTNTENNQFWSRGKKKKKQEFTRFHVFFFFLSSILIFLMFCL